MAVSMGMIRAMCPRTLATVQEECGSAEDMEKSACKEAMEDFRVCGLRAAISFQALSSACETEVAAFFKAWDTPSATYGWDALVSVEVRDKDRMDPALADVVACHRPALERRVAETGTRVEHTLLADDTRDDAAYISAYLRHLLESIRHDAHPPQ